MSTLDAEQAARALLDGQAVGVSVEGEEYDLLPEEVEVHLEARSGLVVSQEGPYLAALHTLLTPELEKEGLARESVRRVQEFRKQAGFEIADRIHLRLEASPRLNQALQEHREYIMAEIRAAGIS